jgi:hypothetical protein
MTNLPDNLPTKKKVELLKLMEEQRRRATIKSVKGGIPNPLQWAYMYRRIDDKPFSLENFRPLKQIYTDDHEQLVVMKPAQVGVSEMAVTRTMHALDVGARYWQTGKSGLNVAYLFPTGGALSDFSKERMTGIQQEHRHIAGMFEGGFEGIGFKQAGASYLYLRSTWIGGKGHNRAGQALLSFPADVLILDEYDRMDPAAVALAEKRMRASTVARELNVSTPTLPGKGIHQIFLQSDQHVWEVPCPSCGAWVEMDFFRDVRAEPDKQASRDARHAVPFETWREWDREVLLRCRWTVHCPSCKHALDRTATGRWVARNPDVTSIRGYHVPALAFPVVNLAKLAVNATSEDPTQLEEFFRSDLGVPYETEGSNVTDSMLDAAGAMPLVGPPYTNVCMGVDVGSRFHFQIAGLAKDGVREILEMGSVRSWDALTDLLNKHAVRRCIIDALPELHGAKTWADEHKGRVFRAFYPNSTQGKALKGELYQVNDEDRTISINRTMAMDAVYARLLGGKERWRKLVVQQQEVRAHMKAPIRVLAEDSSGQPIASWTHIAPDHLYHASVYCLIASLLKPKTRPGVIAQAVTTGWNPR